jgi:hypothetical protein
MWLRTREQVAELALCFVRDHVAVGVRRHGEVLCPMCSPICAHGTRATWGSGLRR